MKKLILIVFALLVVAGTGVATEHTAQPADNATAAQSSAPAADNGTAGSN